MRTSVKNLLNSATALDSVELAGWVRTRRDSKEFSFMELNDGSCLKGIQVIIDLGTPGSEEVGKMNTGAAVKVAGELLESPGQGQSWEVRATEVELVGGVPDDFPLPPDIAAGASLFSEALKVAALAIISTSSPVS